MENEKKLKKNQILIAGGVILVLVIGIIIGNSGHKNESAPIDSGSSQVIPEKPATSIDDIFLITIHSNNNTIIEASSDADLIALGKQVCTTLDAGNTVNSIMLALVGSSTGNESDSYWEFAGIMIGAGVAAYCPEYNDQIG